MANTGNTFPGTGENVDRAGLTAWTNPGNVTADDAADATCNGAGSDYLVARNFGFSIPTGATINGIHVRVEASEHSGGTEALLAQLQDELAALIGTGKTNTNEGNLSGTAKSVYTFGSTSDLWGATLTPAIVNDPDFGVRLWFTTSHDVRIDFVTIDIEYTEATNLEVTGSGGMTLGGTAAAPIEIVVAGIGGAATAGAATSSKDIVVGNALGARFVNGNSDFFTIANHADFRVSDVDWSFSTWMRFGTNMPAFGSLVDWQSGDANNFSWMIYSFTLMYADSVKRFLRVYSKGASGASFPNLDISLEGIDCTKWFNVTLWYDSATDTLYAALNDGTPVSVEVPGGFVTDSTTKPVTINGRDGAASNAPAMNWAIDATGFWKKKLSAAEVTSLYNNGLGKHYGTLDSTEKTDLKVWWDFQESSGSRIDSSGNSHDLTDNNTVETAVGVSGIGISGGAFLLGTAPKIIDLVYTGGMAQRSYGGALNGYWEDASKHHFADSAFSWCAWVKGSPYNDNEGGSEYWTNLMGPWHGYSGDTQEWAFVQNNRTHYVKAVLRGPASGYTMYESVAADARDWIFVAAKHDPTTNKLYFSVNGAAWTETTVPDGCHINGTTVRFSFNSQIGFNSKFSLIQGAGVWAKAIDDTELAALYNSGKGCIWDNLPSTLKGSECQMYIDGVKEASQSSVADKSGNGFSSSVAADDQFARYVWHPGMIEVAASAAITLTGTAPIGGDLTAQVSGGAVLGGVSVPAFDLSLTGIGGAVTGGAGVTNWEFVFTGIGGAQTAGAALTNNDFVWTGVGGGSSGGTGSFILDLVYTGAGGGASGGSAPVSGDLTLTGTGGGTSGGSGQINWDLTFNPTGGASSSGVAAFILDLVYTGVGSAVTGGTAPYEQTGNIEVTGSGGAVLSGVADDIVDLTVTGVGGGISGGAGPIVMDLTRTGAGGSVSGGTGSFVLDFTWLPAGGLSSAGAAVWLLDLVWVGVGGAVLSGTPPDADIDLSVTGTGGAQTAGTAGYISDNTWTGTGGASTGGAGTIAIDLVYTGVGTAILSGNAPNEGGGTIEFTGSGSMITGGTVAPVLDLVWTGVGSAVLSGAAGVTGNFTYTITGEGGAVTGGSGVIAKDLIYVGVGTVTTGGSAQTPMDLVFTGSGSASSSGTATFILDLVYVGVGGLISSGQAISNFDLVRFGVGGAILAGTVQPIGLDTSYTSVGSADLGGLALLGFDMSYEGVGEMVLSGTAPSEIGSFALAKGFIRYRKGALVERFPVLPRRTWPLGRRTNWPLRPGSSYLPW